jgi:hypothetical protein
MSKDSRAFLVLLGTIMFLLVATYLVIGSGSAGFRGSGRFFSRSTVHWYGWVGLVLLGVSATYSVLKRVFPRKIKVWLYVHCIFGVLSIALIGVHLSGRLFAARPSHFLSYFLFGLMFVIVVWGITGRYRLKVPFLREYWRYLHINLTVLFYAVLVLHVLEKQWLI